jgi:putative endonuclease
MRKGYVYMLASKPYGTLYIGVTNNLAERVYAHRIGKASKFTTKYEVTRLVWWEEHDLVADAIRRETNLKRWKRDWKIDLVNLTNPKWLDLYETGAMP